MRFTVLALLVGAGASCFGQSVESVSPENNSSSSPRTNLPKAWSGTAAGLFAPLKAQPNAPGNQAIPYAVQAKTFVFNPVLPTFLIARNSEPRLDSLTVPHARVEPIPTEWPELRVERIPTQWPDLKIVPLDGHSRIGSRQVPVK